MLWDRLAIPRNLYLGTSLKWGLGNVGLGDLREMVFLSYLGWSSIKIK